MMTLIVFIQGLQGMKRKANSQHNEENEYTSKNNESFPNLPLLDRLFPKPQVPQMYLRGLDGTRRRIIFVVS